MSIILCTEIMYYDSVPIILYEVFPQLIFFKFYHEFSPGQRNHRGYVNYNRKVYGLSTSFNFLLGQMEYDEEPSLNDKIAAYIQTKKGFSNSIQIIQIKETQEHWGRNDEIYNYRVEAIFNDEKVEFLIAYDNQEFKNIVGFGVFKDRYKVPGY